MNNDHIDNYLVSSKKQFHYYKSLADKAIAQVEDDQLFFEPDSKSNSIAVIIQHIYGNMLSRWTDFLTTDGEKDFRNRDQEFEAHIDNRELLLENWEKAWQVLFDALNSVNKENFDTIIYIRNMGHTITEAVNRQMTHYAYHVGQIVYLSRLYSKNWESLSVAKGKSQEYNKEKFDKGKRRTHFTDDL